MGDIDDETKEEPTLTELVNIQLNSKPITDELLERTKLMIELCEEVLSEKYGLNCCLNVTIKICFRGEYLFGPFQIPDAMDIDTALELSSHIPSLCMYSENELPFVKGKTLRHIKVDSKKALHFSIEQDQDVSDSRLHSNNTRK